MSDVFDINLHSERALSTLSLFLCISLRGINSLRALYRGRARSPISPAAVISLAAPHRFLACEPSRDPSFRRERSWGWFSLMYG